jgi:hypothetical protein
MRSEIPDNLRHLIVERAGNRCEYCLLPQWAAWHTHEPDHIIATQHGGETEENNLALACKRCNRNKGPNIGSLVPVLRCTLFCLPVFLSPRLPFPLSPPLPRL